MNISRLKTNCFSKSFLVLFLVLFLGQILFLGQVTPAATGAGDSIKGIPKVIRQSPSTEIFLIGVNGGFTIPQNESHNRLLNLFIAAKKENRPIGFTIDPKTRIILQVDGDPGPYKAQLVNDQVEEDPVPKKAGSAATTPVPKPTPGSKVPDRK